MRRLAIPDLRPGIVAFNVTALTYWRADHCYSVLVLGPLDPQPGATSMGRSTALAR
jgi:hypothetical protein